MLSGPHAAVAPTPVRAARATVVSQLITNIREGRVRDFVLFTDSEGGGWSREEMVAERYSRQMPRVGGNLCIPGDHLHRRQSRENEELGSKELAGSKEEVSPI